MYGMYHSAWTPPAITEKEKGSDPAKKQKGSSPLNVEGRKPRQDLPGQKSRPMMFHFEVSKGEVVGLLGPTAAGKTTTFYMITGMIRPVSGRILYDDVDITQFPCTNEPGWGSAT